MDDKKCIYKVYDVIAKLREKTDMSIRRLAMLASISPTTLTSMLQRRPERISIRTLDAIARVFMLEWKDLFNYEEDQVPEIDRTGKVAAVMEEHDFLRVISRLVGEITTPMDVMEQALAQPLGYRPGNAADEFKRSIHFVLDQLNDAGLMEAMRRILDVASEATYRKGGDAP